jgi:serpin B
MTMNGAAAGTFDAMRSTLGFEALAQDEINEAYQGLVALLLSLDPEVDISIANSVWANEDVPFHASFMEAVRDAFAARIESLDFDDPATLTAINDWVDEHTRGMIPTIIDDLDPDLVMLLINAVAFEARWSTAFDPDDTRRQTFTRGDGSTVEVDMMTITDVDLPLGGGEGYQAAELPYGGGAYAMVVVVPQGPATIGDFVAGLDAARWAEILSSLSPRNVDLVALPKVTLSYDVMLNDALKAMGMEVAFDGRADFTNLSPIGGELCIDYVRQKTFLEVDEAGTKAAAATAVGIGPTSFNGLVADRPYLLAIHERLSGTLLFAGVVGDPTHEDSGPAEGEGSCH